MGLTNSDAKDSSLQQLIEIEQQENSNFDELAKEATLSAFKSEQKTESDETQSKIDSTNTKLDTLNSKDFSTAAKQDTQSGKLDTLIAKDYSTQTTLAAVLAKIIEAPATEAKQDTLIANQTNGTQITQIQNTTGTWANGVETSVAGTAVQIQAANASRKKLIIQNVGNANARIGITGVTATTGTRLVPGGVMILEPPYIETAAIYAIREGAISTTIFTQETV